MSSGGAVACDMGTVYRAAPNESSPAAIRIFFTRISDFSTSSLIHAYADVVVSCQSSCNATLETSRHLAGMRAVAQNVVMVGRVPCHPAKVTVCRRFTYKVGVFCICLKMPLSHHP